MTQPIGEEFIKIRPDASAFRAELEAQIGPAMAAAQKQASAAIPAVQKQAAASVAAVKRQAAAVQKEVAAAVSSAATPVVIPPGVSSVRPLIEQKQAQEALAEATRKTAEAQRSIVLPAGVRELPTVTSKATTATRTLTAATTALATEQKTLFLPGGANRIVPPLERAKVATDAVTKATERLAAARLAANQAAAAGASQIILPTARRTREEPKFVVTAPGGERQIVSTLKEAEQLAAAAGGSFEQLGTSAAAAEQQLEKAAAATTKSASASSKLTASNRGVQDTIRKTGQIVNAAERDVGRYTRGMVAATAASTGFFRAVSFASGSFLIGAAVGATIGQAINEFKAMTSVAAQTTAVIKATGGSANVTSAQVDALAKSTLDLTGIDDELVKSSANILLTFRSIRNEVGKGNDVFNRAVRAVVDISSVFKTDLRGSAVQLGKALQDPIRGVTALRRSGITLSQAQRDLIKRLVETGRILTAQKIILGEVERQVGGTAEAVGQTLPGQLARMREESKNSLGEYVKRISESQKATESFVATTGGISDGLKSVRGAVAVVVEVLAEFAKATELDKAARALQSLVQAVGGLRTLVQVAATAVAVFAALKLALLAASVAQGAYTRLTTVAVAATVAEGEAVAATTARVSLSAGLLTAATGPLGIAVAITGAIILLDTLRGKLGRTAGSVKAFQAAIAGFTQNVSRIQGLRNQLASASEDVSIRRLDVGQADRGVAAARRNVAQTNAQPGSLQARFLADQLTQALQKQRDAVDALNQAVAKQAALQAQLTGAQSSQPFVIDNTTKSINAQLDAVRGLNNIYKFALSVGIAVTPELLRSVGDQIERATKVLDKFRTSGSKVQRDVAQPLLAILAVLGRLPTRKEVNLVLKAVGEGQTTKQILALLGIGGTGGRDFAPRFGFGESTAVPRTTEDANLRERVKAAQALLALERERLKVLREGGKLPSGREVEGLNVIREKLRLERETVAAKREQVKAAREAVTAAREGVVTAQDALRSTISALRDARQALADTIIAAGQAVTQAVADAKANLGSLGEDIAGILGQVVGKTTQVAGRLGPEFQKLRDQIFAGGGGPDTQKAAQQISFRLAAKTPTIDPDKITQRFDNLSNQLATGQITFAQFKKRINDLVTPADIAKVKHELGPAAAARLRNLVTTFVKQGLLISTGPKREGGIFQAVLVKPVEAIKQGAKDIAAGIKQVGQAQKDIASARKDLTKAQQGVVDAKHDLLDAERELRKEQAKATQLNTRAVAANTKVQQKILDVEKARLALEGKGKGKPKPKNPDAQTSDKLVGAGAQTP